MCEYPQGSAALNPPAQQINVISKLNHLESLIHSLRNGQSTASDSHTSNGQPSRQCRRESESPNTDGLPSTFGRLSLDYKEQSYVGSDHWVAIIDGVGTGTCSQQKCLIGILTHVCTLTDCRAENPIPRYAPA